MEVDPRVDCETAEIAGFHRSCTEPEGAFDNGGQIRLKRLAHWANSLGWGQGA